MPRSRLSFFLLKNVVDEWRFGVLGHENFWFKAADLGFVESAHMVITATVRILRFSNFIRILVFIGVCSDLKLENCWSCQPQRPKCIILSCRHLTSLYYAITIHQHLWACLFNSAVPWYLRGHCVVMTRGRDSFSFCLFHNLWIESFPRSFLKLIFMGMSMFLNRYLSLLPVFLLSVQLWRNFGLGHFNDVV